MGKAEYPDSLKQYHLLDFEESYVFLVNPTTVWKVFPNTPLNLLEKYNSLSCKVQQFLHQHPWVYYGGSDVIEGIWDVVVPTKVFSYEGCSVLEEQFIPGASLLIQMYYPEKAGFLGKKFYESVKVDRHGMDIFLAHTSALLNHEMNTQGVFLNPLNIKALDPNMLVITDLYEKFHRIKDEVIPIEK